jgi:hypothetical protein
MLGVNPNDASNVGIAGFWMALAGDEDEGLALLDKAIDLNPFYPGWFHFPYFLHHFARGEYDQAYVRSLDIKMPGLFWDPLLRTAASSQIGRIVEAQTALHELLQLKPDFPNHAHHHLGRLILVDELRGQLLSALYEAGLPDVEPTT